MLAELRAAGLRFTARGDTLYVEPVSALTDTHRATIRAHKARILRELTDESRERHRAILAARDSAPLADFRAALVLGRLHVCCNCSRFTFGTPPAGVGHCEYFQVDAWPFVPFWCSGFRAGTIPAAPEFLPDPDGTRAIRASR